MEPEAALRARCTEAVVALAALAMRGGGDSDAVASEADVASAVTPALASLLRETERASSDELSPDQKQKQLRRWMPSALLVCACVTCGRLPSTERAHSDAEKALAQCEALVGASSRAELLARFAAPLVALCSQSCSKDEWVDRRSLPKHALCWVVLQLPFPHLGGDLLGRLLALVFPLIDDLSNESQAVGASMLQHVVRSVTATELRWYGDVLLEVLRPAITSRQPETLDALLDALTTALDKLSPPGEFAHFDTFFPRLLTDASLCTDVSVRALFLRRLRPAIVRMGAPQSVHVIRYLQPLLKVVVASFESINVPLLLEALETLRVTIRSAWPRVPAHAEEIFVGVMRAVAFCEVFDAGAGSSAAAPHEREQLLARCEHLLLLLADVSACSGSRPEPAGGVDCGSESGDVPSSPVERMLQEVSTASAALRPFCGRMAKILASEQQQQQQQALDSPWSV
ncbi:hypothetical protein PybrP1_007335 [[Pythium] brassicae (nom. inval.)]|nr:hypothetical protein PybrP1_007335 [[Pythium] brassicae (nom. inval.)]